ncbi:MAG: tetratricopeptide repeat protein, partial [Bacteroidetes bacterium]|nr:tetratricopeptide repeat protein [Bacteroidota bacterium]
MPRNLGIFILCGILFWGCQPSEQNSVSKENVQPDSVIASGSSYSIEEKISQNLAKLHQGTILEQDSLLSIRIELVEQLNEKGDRELAKMHLDTLERALIQRKDSQSIFFVQTANLLGSYYFRNRNPQEALAYYQAASRTNENLPSPDTAALVKSLVNAGVILDQLDQYQAAYEVYTQSLPLAEAMRDTANDRLARIYNNIGNVLLHQQKPFQAEGWFEKSAD